MNKRILIIGAGFAGSVIARELANHEHKVCLIDKRGHIGGNAYDYYDQSGNLIHKYGPHIFHTNSKKIFDYLSQFTNWRYYSHCVLAKVQNELLPIPINRLTINKLYSMNLKEDEVQGFFDNVKTKIDIVRTSEDQILSTVGRDLCDKFFRGYTKKQWGLDLSELSASVAARIPYRTNDDCRYFSDKYQYMPKHGYTELFNELLNNENISLFLEKDFKEINKDKYDAIVFTGPIDSYFNFIYGKLPYRSLEFKHEIINQNFYQKVGTVNYPNDYDFTRITEFKHLTGVKTKNTSIVKEFPRAEGDPYYPIPNILNENKFSR